MASDEPIPNTMVVVEPKAKNEYKTKNEKEKSAIVEEFIALRQTMVGEELRDENAQSIKKMVEETTKAPPCKSKKKTKGKYKANPSRAKAHERTLSPIT
jgi:hypothetical protein